MRSLSTHVIKKLKRTVDHVIPPLRKNQNNMLIYKNNKSDISTLYAPLKELATNVFNGNDYAIEVFCKSYGLQHKSGWFLPQLVHKFSELKLQKNESGKYSPRALYDNYIKRDPTLYALLALAKHSKRSSILKEQTKNAEFSSLVPLVLSGFKRYHDIPYSAWDAADLDLLVETGLYEAMTKTQDLPSLTKEEILEERLFGLTIKTGGHAGEVRSATSTYSLFMHKDSPLYNVPKLAKIMVCQTWCAHPSIRNKYMILDPLDWDRIPEPLISTDVLLPCISNMVHDVPIDFRREGGKPDGSGKTPPWER